MKDNTMSEGFTQLVYKRTEFNRSDWTPEYEAVFDKICRLSDAFRSKLSEELDQQYMEICDAYGEESFWFAVMVYRRGLADGVQLPRLVMQKDSTDCALENMFAAM